MKKLALLIMIMCFALHGKATNYADYVNPLIGTLVLSLLMSFLPEIRIRLLHVRGV